MTQNTFCQKCKLWMTCRNPCIVGRGDKHAGVLLIGEAPGKEEDQQGSVFVGSAGQKLDLYLHQLQTSVFITNAVKCRPTVQNDDKLANRTPTSKEILLCAPKTYQLIDKLQPKVIVTLGAVPTKQILNTSVGMDLIHGKLFYHPIFQCYVVPTWHPAYLLYAQDKKVDKEFYEDLRYAVSLLNRPVGRRICCKPKSLSVSEEIKQYLEKLKHAEVFSCDIETTGRNPGDSLNPRKGRISDISFCMKPGEGVHIRWDDILPHFDALKAALENPVSKKVGHNFRFDMKFLRKFGIDVQNFYFDTMLAYHTLSMAFEGKGQSLYSLDMMSWLFTHEGDYKSILESYGGIVGYQDSTIKDDTAEDQDVAQYTNSAKELLESEANISTTVKDSSKDASSSLSLAPIFLLHTEDDEHREVILSRFSHLEDLNKDLSLLNSFLPKTRTLKSPADKKPVYVIDEKEEEELQYYSTFIQKKMEARLKELNLTPIQFYSAMDADITLRLYYKLEPEIEKNFKFVFYNLVMPLSNTLLRLEENGVLLDRALMEEVYEKNNEEIEEIKKQLYKKVGFEFNLDSSKELREVIYKHMKVKVNPKFMTRGGKQGVKLPSTDKETIEFLSKQYPQLLPIVRYRELAKQNSTSIKGFQKLIDTDTGRIYGQFLQHTTATGRLSSANPNLQNIPRDSKIRNMFIPSPGHKFVTCDLSQAELRILAMVSGDKKMQNAFLSGHDFHTFTACTMFRIPIEEFDKSNPQHARARGIAKNINFGVAYQMTASSLADDLDITLEEAQKFIDTFYSSYPDVKRWVDHIMRFAQKHGYVETVHGRRRYLPNVYSSKEDVKLRALRQAVNTPIQGTASDCACFGLIRLQHFLDANKMKSKPVMIIHDEIVVDTLEEEIPILQEKLPEFMTKDLPLITIPLVADLHVLDRWEK